MPTPEEIMIAQLDAADLQPALYRTARRIIDRINPANNYCRVTYAEMAGIAGTDSQATVRAHLARLAAARLITYRRNSAVHIYWHADAPTTPESRAPAPPPADDAASESRALSTESRALSTESRAPAQPPADDAASESRALSTESRALSTESRALSTESRAAKSTTTTSRLAGLDTTASQPAGKGSGETQPPTTAPATAPLTETQQRALAMLTDSAIGMDEAAAMRIARKFRHGQVLIQCCRYLRDADAGKVDNPVVIGYRLSKSYGGSILKQDHNTEFWARHGGFSRFLPKSSMEHGAEADEAEADEAVSDVAPRPAPHPPPEPGTPAAIWYQLQRDFALHQQPGSVDNVIQDSWVIACDDGVFTIGIADAYRLDWVEKKLSPQIKRKLAIIMNRQTVDVKFVVQSRPIGE